MMKISLSRSCFFYFRGINTPFQSHHPISQFRYLLFLDRSSTKEQPLVAFCHSNLVYVELFTWFAANMRRTLYPACSCPLWTLSMCSTYFSCHWAAMSCLKAIFENKETNKRLLLFACTILSGRVWKGPICRMYSFTMPNVFVQIDKYICSNWQIYLSCYSPAWFCQDEFVEDSKDESVK